MATYTPNLNLKKPDYSDLADVADINANMDVIDGQISTKKRTVRFVVGTSTAGWTSADCDYLCDGTADQVEINNAITALPASGGEVVILDGTYNITAKIDVTKHNVSIRGNGNATILKRMFDSSVGEGVITLLGRSDCKIANLQVDGNKASFTSIYNLSIYLNSSNDNNTVTGNTFNNNGGHGIHLRISSNNTVTGNTFNNNGSHGINLTSSSNNIVTGNTCNNNNSHGIYLINSSSNNTITGNTCNNNSSGINLSSSNNTITGNTCNNNDTGVNLSSSDNTVTGNTCNNNNYGIYLAYSSSNNTVTGNTCNSNNSGIYLNYSSNNAVTGNTCIRGTGLETNYTESQHTIHLIGTSNSYNLISNNNCMGKAVTDEGGTGNTLVNNKWNDYGDVYDATITTTWIGDVAPYTQDVTVTGFTAYDTPTITPVYSATLSTSILEKEAWNMISKAVTSTNTITFTCFEEKPVTAIPIKIRRG